MNRKTLISSDRGRIARACLVLLGGIWLLTPLALVSCQNFGSTALNPETRTEPVSSPKSGAQLWAQNCANCHNLRDPSSLSDAHWDVAMLHMRTRANLTASDAAAIREFILSAN